MIADAGQPASTFVRLHRGTRKVQTLCNKSVSNCAAGRISNTFCCVLFGSSLRHVLPALSRSPRAGRIEEEVRMARSVELVAQRRRVELHLKAQSKAVKAQAVRTGVLPAALC